MRFPSSQRLWSSVLESMFHPDLSRYGPVTWDPASAESQDYTTVCEVSRPEGEEGATYATISFDRVVLHKPYPGEFIEAEGV